MAINTDVSQLLIENLRDIYINAENKILEQIKNRTKESLKGTWQIEKIRDIRTIRKEINSLLNKTHNNSKTVISNSIINSYKAGVLSANIDMKALRDKIGEVVPEHINRLILETHGLIDRTSFQILRNTEDAYRQIIADISSGVLVGVETKEQVLQQALNRFAEKGISGFTDRAGRKWELASYVEMATRTTTARAALQGHVDRQYALGNDLIRISSIQTTCPLCLPFQGQVLSISGNTPGYMSLEIAKGAGLFHPNCKHTITAYFPDVEDAPEPILPDKQKALEQYRNTQKQRYNERQIRKWKRLESVALSDVVREQAHKKILAWQKKQRELTALSGLKRRYGRESIKGRLPIKPDPVPTKILPSPKIKPVRKPKLPIVIQPQPTEQRVDLSFGFENIGLSEHDKIRIQQQLTDKMNAPHVNQNYKKLFISEQEALKLVDEKTNSGFFRHATRTVHVDFLNEQMDIRGPYIISLHEIGHFMDWRLKTAVGNLSADKRLVKSLREDFLDTFNRYKKARGFEGMLERDEIARVNLDISKDVFEKQQRKKGYDGVSDILGGLTGNQIQGGFGHSLAYWQRGATPELRDFEITSEFFAHAAAAMSDERNFAGMQEYFPKSMKVFATLLKEAMKAKGIK